MGPIRNPNWSTSGMRVTLSYLSSYKSAHLISWVLHCEKNVSLCKFGINTKINQSSFQQCKNFKMTRTITNKTNGKKCTYPMFFVVDVDMFYKSAHLFLYQVWRAWNAKIGVKCQ